MTNTKREATTTTTTTGANFTTQQAHDLHTKGMISNPDFEKAVQEMEQEKTTATTDTTPKHEPITPDNLYNAACKAAYHTIKLLHTQAPTETMRGLLNGFAHLKDGNDTNELIQVAALALMENMTANNDNAFPLACKAVRKFVYDQNKQHATTTHTTLYKQLLKIRKILKGQNIKASPAELDKLTDIIVEKSITADNVEGFIAEEKTRAQTSYTSTNMYIHDYEKANGDIVNVNDELSKLFKNMAFDEVLGNIRKNLTPSQLKVLYHMALGRPNNVIAAKMGLAKQTVQTHIDRIKAKVAVLYPNGINDIF